ncbi:MAG: 50S ribosomal protein L4 [Solobacterium sp.]|nr:50S ribosomal protein L4 [Erysipelotrichaceae bacterium]MCI6700104.1 50S ribosomal protein L4 [Solobacterium sp.]MCI7732331.1 50S ribosomal protein L4 [Solobacterium sp.]MDD5842050.1 50S ribosomal protein L4 [Solobacterium sp.]MDD5982587.1 50S ribosomal protein L4 [Solobacterium sp.]
MANYDVYDLKAAKVGEVELADEVFACEVNTQAIFDAVLRQQSSWRQGTHKVKNRREVSGGGKKPFRQKGTGRARQGSSRAVQYRGGGIAFGPTPRSHTFKLNRKVRRLALRSGLTLKAQANEMFVLDSIAMDAMKTKEFVKVLGGFKADRKSLFVVDIEDDFDNAYMASRNIPGVVMVTVEGLNIYDLQNADKLFMTKKAALKTQEVLSND